MELLTLTSVTATAKDAKNTLKENAQVLKTTLNVCSVQNRDISVFAVKTNTLMTMNATFFVITSTETIKVLATSLKSMPLSATLVTAT